MIFLKKYKFHLLTLFVLIAFACISIQKYIYKPHDKIEDIKPFFIGKSKDFIKEANADYDLWNTKTIELTGVISTVLENGFILDDFIFCQLKNNSNNITKNQTITVKGTVIGYDELLNELKLNQCIIK